MRIMLGMARRPRDGTPARNLTFRVYDEDRERWEAAAAAAGLTLSAWLTAVANQKAPAVHESSRDA